MKQLALRMLEFYGVRDLVLPTTLVVRGDDKRINRNLIEFHDLTQKILQASLAERLLEVKKRVEYFDSGRAKQIEAAYSTTEAARLHWQNIAQIFGGALSEFRAKQKKVLDENMQGLQEICMNKAKEAV